MAKVEAQKIMLSDEKQQITDAFDKGKSRAYATTAVSYTHLRAHETPEHLVCRLLLEKKNNQKQENTTH